MAQPIRISVLGPESSGKSTLCKILAERLGGTYIPEYAREYIYGLGLHYGYEEVCHVGEQNLKEWQAAEGLTFYDTEFIITRVWMDVEFGKHPEWMDNAPTSDFYLICSPDLPAVDEPIRTNNTPERREHYFNVYLEEIRKTGKPYGIVSGLGDARTECALNLIRQQFPQF